MSKSNKLEYLFSVADRIDDTLKDSVAAISKSITQKFQISQNLTRNTKKSLFFVDVKDSKSYEPETANYTMPTLVFLTNLNGKDTPKQKSCVRYVQFKTKTYYFDIPAVEKHIKEIITNRCLIYEYTKLQSMIQHAILLNKESPLTFLSNSLLRTAGINIYQSNQARKFNIYYIHNRASDDNNISKLVGILNRDDTPNTESSIVNDINVIVVKGIMDANKISTEMRQLLLQKHKFEMFNLVIFGDRTSTDSLRNFGVLNGIMGRCVFSASENPTEDIIANHVNAAMVNEQSRINSFTENSALFKEGLTKEGGYKKCNDFVQTSLLTSVSDLLA